jgi:hypothetical protein
MADAEIYNKGGTDKTEIFNVRAGRVQPFQAPGWTDLRLALFLSLTKAANDDDPSGLTETIGGDFTLRYDRYTIGLTDRETGTSFIGYTNFGAGHPDGQTRGRSKLVSSDAGIGTSNANFWRPKNELTDVTGNVQIIEGPTVRARGRDDGCQIHLPQNPAGAGGYATLLMIRLTRPTPDSRVITATFKSDLVNHNGDVLYTNNPDDEAIKTNLQAFPTNVHQLGPVEMTHVPSVLLLYWPFSLSRLRCHNQGIEKKRE